MDSRDIEKIMALGNIIQSGVKSGSDKDNDKNRDENIEPNKIKRQIKTLNNIIPYLDSSMKRNIYMLVKIMEMADFNNLASLISTQAKKNFDQKGFIEAAQKYLLPEEKQVFTTLYMLSRMRETGILGRRNVNG